VFKERAKQIERETLFGKEVQDLVFGEWGKRGIGLARFWQRWLALQRVLYKFLAYCVLFIFIVVYFFIYYYSLYF
jgi:hypothetical protein